MGVVFHLEHVASWVVSAWQRITVADHLHPSET